MEPIEQVEIEPGVTRITPPKYKYGYPNGDVFLYRLDDMSAEAIARYGLTSANERYQAGKLK